MGLKTLTLWVGLLALPAAAQDTIRIATFDPGLTRKGPGLLLRDITNGNQQVQAAAQVIAAAAPDAIVLTGFDWDLDGIALTAFAQVLSQHGLDMPHRFTAMPNRGLPTGLDLDADGRLAEADDAQGWGQFTGQNGMAVMSRLPIGGVTDHSAFLWRDLSGHLMPQTQPRIDAIQRLSTTSHWDVSLTTPHGPLHLLVWSATAPVFDGPEDRNGRRNHDEAVFWLDRLPPAPFVMAGKLNLDPQDGDGRREAFDRLLTKVTDPQPRGNWQPPQTGANADHLGDPALDTAVFDAGSPGNLRVDYVLPAQDIPIVASGVLWPEPDDPMAEAVSTASNHRLVWVDVIPYASKEAIADQARSRSSALTQ